MKYKVSWYDLNYKYYSKIYNNLNDVNRARKYLINKGVKNVDVAVCIKEN